VIERDELLVDAPTLAAELAGAEPPVVLDVRWRVGHPDGEDDHLAGHIPGAVYVALETELAAPGLPDTAGRLPLPGAGDFQAAARRWGIRAGSRVVMYDDNQGIAAARAWWLLRHAGHAQVRLLDGGLSAWTAGGFPVARRGTGQDRVAGLRETPDLVLDESPVMPGTGDEPHESAFIARFGAMPLLDIDGAASVAARGALLDARPGEWYRGEVERTYRRAGHIPGALNAPASGNLDSAGRLLPAAELRARFEALGLPPAGAASGAVGTYCGAGVASALQVLALALAGYDAAFYPGGWSQWSSHSERTIEVGAGAGAR